jgi:vancomycin resistance protein YoaR
MQGDRAMQKDAQTLKREIKELQKEINALRVRMPPHDPSMAMMMEMDELEIRQDELKAELEALNGNSAAD